MKQSFKVIAGDGYPISVTSYIPTNSNDKIVLINSATGVKQGFYSKFATFLAEQGFSVFTYDYRGIGDSQTEDITTFNAMMHHWGALDYHAVLKHLFLTYTDSEFIVLGHSVGGQIIGMSPLSENVDRIVMVGSQVPYYKHYKGTWMKAKLIGFWYFLLPFFTYSFGYFPSTALGLFENLPAGVALQWARWAKSSNFIFDELPRFKERFTALQQRALMINFSDDNLAPATAVESLMKVYANIKWQNWNFTPEDLAQKKVGHFGFFKRKTGQALWQEVSNWISDSSILKRSKAA